VIVRAIGPELSAPPFNVPRALSDPTLELHDGTGALIASNHNWVPRRARSSSRRGARRISTMSCSTRANTTGVALVECTISIGKCWN